MSNSFVPPPPPEATSVGSTRENATENNDVSLGASNTGTKRMRFNLIIESNYSKFEIYLFEPVTLLRVSNKRMIPSEAETKILPLEPG